MIDDRIEHFQRCLERIADRQHRIEKALGLFRPIRDQTGVAARLRLMDRGIDLGARGRDRLMHRLQLLDRPLQRRQIDIGQRLDAFDIAALGHGPRPGDHAFGRAADRRFADETGNLGTALQPHADQRVEQLLGGGAPRLDSMGIGAAADRIDEGRAADDEQQHAHGADQQAEQQAERDIAETIHGIPPKALDLF